MKLWPSDEFEVHTTMSPAEVQNVVDGFVEPPKWFRLFHNGKPFEGKCSSEGFKISRVIRYRNSFLPVIHGTYAPGTTGTAIHVRMRLHHFVLAFMCVWFGGVGIGVFVAIAAAVSRGTIFHPTLLVPFAMIVFGIALVSGGFWFEAKKQRPMLEALLHGKRYEA